MLIKLKFILKVKITNLHLLRSSNLCIISTLVNAELLTLYPKWELEHRLKSDQKQQTFDSDFHLEIFSS